MDIQRAKEEIKRAVQAYLATDDIGRPLIPAVRQRPILLMGPPGVGKTQIMEQIAQEGAELRRAHPQRDRVHDERDHRQRLRRHGAHRQEKRHPVHRRDQLRQRDAGPHDAAIFAVQDLRQSGCAGRLGHCGRGQSAGVQQERAGV